MLRNNRKLLFLSMGTIFALVPGFIIRFTEPIYMWLFTKLTTYPGDLWNFWANYLGKGLIYPPEYPAGLRFFYEIFRFDQYQNYTWFFTVNAIILALFAIGTTILLYKILQKTENGKQVTNLWWFWILAPSFIFYSFLNYDLPVVFLIVLAVYLFLDKKYYWAVGSLALGTVLKVFPIFLLPVFILRASRKQWGWLLLVFGSGVLLLNLPYMLSDFNGWIFPYTWQISQNLSRDPSAGTYWWLMYGVFKNYTGWVSMLLFGGLYIFTLIKLKKSTFINLCLAVIIIFLLTDRVYSPQYNLYLLPFLALAAYPVNKTAFYLTELPNVAVVLFCFFLKGNPVYLQLLVVARYSGLVWLYLNNYFRSQNK